MLYNNKIAEHITNIDGEEMVIADYRGHNDVTVVYKDNEIQKTTYAAFRSRRTRRKKNAQVGDHINQQSRDADGNLVTIIKENDPNDITVKYQDGDIMSKLNINDVIMGDFKRTYEVSPFERILFGDGKDSLDNVDQERRRTMESAAAILQKYHKCIVVRPPGFGKTRYIATGLLKSPRYTRCLFLYPNKNEQIRSIIQSRHIKKPVPIDIMSYDDLIRKSDNFIKSMKYDFVVMDECHMLGGDEISGSGAIKRYTAIQKLIKSHPDTDFLGLTATIERMDGIDVGSKIFMNHYCYPYTYEDAFQDGILQRPYYYAGEYYYEEKLKKGLENIIHRTASREDVKLAFDITDEQLDRLDTKNMEKHIRDICDEVVDDTSYMRFVIFYVNNNDIAKNKKKMEDWFQRAYPNHEVHSLIVTSKEKADLDMVDALPTEPEDPSREGRIDLIFNCKMLSFGYHSDLLTGVVLDCRTYSLSFFLQKIGRVLSSKGNQKIVFDIQDNIDADFVCNVKELPDLPPVVIDTKAPEKILAYETLRRKYPNAIDWDKSDESCEGARIVEIVEERVAALRNAEMNNFETTPEDTDESAKTFTTPAIDIDDDTDAIDNDISEPLSEEKNFFKKGIDKIVNEVKNKGLRPSQILEDYKNLTEQFAISKANNDEPLPEPEPFIKPFGSMLERTRAYEALNTNKVKEEKPATSKESLEEFGFPIGVYNRDSKGRLNGYATLVLNSVEIPDAQARIVALEKQYAQKDIENAIEYWHEKYPHAEDFRTYEEYERAYQNRSPQVLTLLKVCDKFGRTPKEVIRFMVENPPQQNEH